MLDSCFYRSNKCLLSSHLVGVYLFVFAYFFNPEFCTLIPHGLKWDTRQSVPLKIWPFLCLKCLEEPVPPLLLPCKCCKEQVQLSRASAAALGAHYTALVVSAFPFFPLPRSARMKSSPLLQIVPLLCQCRICGGLMWNVL